MISLVKINRNCGINESHLHFYLSFLYLDKGQLSSRKVNEEASTSNTKQRNRTKSATKTIDTTAKKASSKSQPKKVANRTATTTDVDSGVDSPMVSKRKKISEKHAKTTKINEKSKTAISKAPKKRLMMSVVVMPILNQIHESMRKSYNNFC